MRDAESIAIAITLILFAGLAGLGVHNHYQATAKQAVSSTSTVEVTTLGRSEQDKYLQAINRLRSSEGIEPLEINSRLNASAQLKANDMKAKDYWSHDAPDGTEPWHYFREVKYEYTRAGENLARCYDTPEETVQAWSDSPTHRDNMLADHFSETGFGAYEREDGCRVIVNHFGSQI